MNRRTFLAAVAASPVMPAAVRLAAPCKHEEWDHDAKACRDCGVKLHELWSKRLPDLMADMKEMWG